MGNRFSLPGKGKDKKELLSRLEAYKKDDIDWKGGRSWSLVYYAGDEHAEFVKRAYNLYMSENGAGPTMFPSLRRLESEVIAAVLDLLGGHDTEVGCMTSGGTESILLAMRAYREQARVNNPENTQPEVLLPESAHPAILKAAGYFGITPVYIPLDADYRADTGKIEGLITSRTICMVASAPSFPHGVVDPIRQMGELAQEHGIGLHVDACLGSFVLPFLKKSGRTVPGFDFEVPGVTSISADLHKNGYAAKGASVILYRSTSLMRHQFFVDVEWPGGIYASPTMQGTRAGGAIAAAWASLMALGESGYLKLAKRAVEVTDALVQGISSIEGLHVLGEPDMNVIAFTSETLNILSVGERLDNMGWRVNRINNPPALHLIATPNHAQVVSSFIADLEKACAAELSDPIPLPAERAVLYGGTEAHMGVGEQREQALSRLENLFKLG